MTYDFDRIVDRQETPNIKWHWYDEDVLPMWVADMDFCAPEPVVRALRERVAHGVFGYEMAPDALREAIVEQLDRRFGWRVEPEALFFLPGVVPGFNLAVQAFVPRGAGLMIQTPVYPPILHAAEDAGRLSQSMMLSLRDDGSYGVDFDLFQRTVTAETRMFLLCNPHNPAGRVFRRDELERMAEICLEQDLVICSDEIHCDLVFPGHRHIPIATLSPEVAARTVTLMAPSKTFNVAGLHCAFAVIPDPDLRERYKAGRQGLISFPNLMGYTAALAAYREGWAWLAALLDYLRANRDYVADYVAQHLPGIRMALPEGTYLAWLDCREGGIPTAPQRFFLERGRVALNAGETFGPGGEGFVRLNFGCPREILHEGLDRLRRAWGSLD